MNRIDIERINNHIHKMEKYAIEANHGISSLLDTIHYLNDSIHSLNESSRNLLDRVKILESDLNDRITRRKIYKSLIFFYPVVISIFLIISDIRKDSTSDVLKEIRNIFTYSKNVMN